MKSCIKSRADKPRSKNQGSGLSDANPLQMGRHLGPVQPRSVVMTEVVSLVHEVRLITERHGSCKIILGMFRITEGVLHPSGDCHNEIHA
jgi:hypothetical protein